MFNQLGTRSLVIAATVFGFFAFTGCSTEDNPTDPTPAASEASAEDDAAESIAADLGAKSGGVLDDVNTLVAYTVEGVEPDAGANPLARGWPGDASATYDWQRGVWEIEINRTYGNPGEVPYTSVARSIELQFLGPDGDPQQRFETNGVKAATVTMDIMSATGEAQTRRLEQRLDSLEASFVATGADTDMITINANYARGAGNVLTTQGSTRTLDHEVTLTIVDLIVPRPELGALSLPVGGTIRGSYDADITFESGNLYGERTVAMDFEVSFDEDPSEDVLESEEGQWAMDLGNGEVQ